MDDDEKNTISISDSIISAGNPNKLCVNKSGLYALVLGSTKPEAKVFRKWITNVVIPSIEEKGYYSVKNVVVPFDNETLLLQFMENTKKLIEDKRQLESERDEAIKTKAQISSSREASVMGKLSGAVKQLKAKDETIQVLKETLAEKDKEHDNTVLGFCQLHGFKVSTQQASIYGRTLTKICKDKNIKLESKQFPGEKYKCNIYPVNELYDYFSKLGYVFNL